MQRNNIWFLPETATCILLCVALASFPGSHYAIFDHLQCAKQKGAEACMGPFYQVGKGGEWPLKWKRGNFLQCWSVYWCSECWRSKNVATSTSRRMHKSTLSFEGRPGNKASLTPPLNSVKVLSCYAGIVPLPRPPPHFLSLAAGGGPEHNTQA